MAVNLGGPLRFQGAKKPLNQVATLLEPPNKAQGTWRFDYVSNLEDPKAYGCAETAAKPIGIYVVRACIDDDITIPVSQYETARTKLD